MRKTTILFIIMCCISQMIYGQAETSLLMKYRQMALDYNHDLKAAEKNISASIELIKSAKDDLKPSLRADANLQYTGNPMELTIDIPSFGNPMSFQAEPMRYGAALSLQQPLYTGGKILETIRLSQYQKSLSSNTFDMIRSAVCFQTDIQYWNTVANVELTSLFEASYQSTLQLRKIVEERVNTGIANPQDLLMVEVKLNNSQYQLMKSQNDEQTNRMALNSLIGNTLNNNIQIDRMVNISVDMEKNRKYGDRPEIRMAFDKINIQQSALKINKSKYKPQLHVGAEGGYYSPGYNFKSDLDVNYTLYAKLSVPVFEWGKRRSDRRAYGYKISMAQDNLNKVQDNVNLEQQKAKVNLEQSMHRVELMNNSLAKAEENESKAIERYNEGTASVVEVIDAQIYRLTTQVNFVQAKLALQINYAELLKSIDAYNLK